MKYLIPFLLLFMSCSNKIIEPKPIQTNNEVSTPQSIHDFSVNDINGETFDFKSLSGKKVLIVNTASKCGLTPQYEGLQKLYEKYKDDNFVIVGFPANNFMSQEPGSDDEIKLFCESKFQVTFPMMSKISVKGKEQHPIYAFLTNKEKNGVSDSKVSWNFQKYAIDENGFVVNHFSPKTSPMNEDIINWIEGKN